MKTKLVKPNQTAWNDYTQHEFVVKLANGSLDSQSFRHYLQQDYLFLKQYARAYALAVYKSDSIADMLPNLACLTGLIENEIQLHINYCRDWDIRVQQLDELEEGVATVAYTRFVLDTGQAGDLTDLLVALAPCALGYAQIGFSLNQDVNTLKKGNPYLDWIETYASEEFIQSAIAQMAHLERLLAQLPDDSPRWAKLSRIFSTATRMEAAFWQQGLDVNEG
ncbi:thiaminase II [Marinomonas sp. 42_23_T18]|nr:thiaminase II [Marinomonas sp. 42_23_T18]